MAKTIKVHLDDRKLQEIMRATSEPVRRRVIADGVNYGLFQELGSSRAPAQPFLIPAFEQGVQGLGDTLGQAVERGVSLDNVMSKTAFDIQRMAQELAPVDTGALKNSLHVETE